MERGVRRTWAELSPTPSCAGMGKLDARHLRCGQSALTRAVQTGSGQPNALGQQSFDRLAFWQAGRGGKDCAIAGVVGGTDLLASSKGSPYVLSDWYPAN